MVIPRKPELSADTAYYFIDVLTTGTNPSFTYFYFRSTNPTHSRQLVLEQQVICLIIKTPLANGKVCTSVFYLKATQIINLLIRTNKGMKNTLHGVNSSNFLKTIVKKNPLAYPEIKIYQTKLVSLSYIKLTLIHSNTIAYMLLPTRIRDSFTGINQCTMLFVPKGYEREKTEIILKDTCFTISSNFSFSYFCSAL